MTPGRRPLSSEGTQNLADAKRLAVSRTGASPTRPWSSMARNTVRSCWAARRASRRCAGSTAELRGQRLVEPGHSRQSPTERERILREVGPAGSIGKSAPRKLMRHHARSGFRGRGRSGGHARPAEAALPRLYRQNVCEELRFLRRPAPGQPRWPCRPRRTRRLSSAPPAVARRPCCVPSPASIPPSSGTITQAGRDITALPPAQRDFPGIVFQSYALFPNLTVAAQNIAYGLRGPRLAARPRVKKRGDCLSPSACPSRPNKYPAQLSAGNSSAWRWRARSPTSLGLLLLDEPLSALDAIVRVYLLRRTAQPAAPPRRHHHHGDP